MSQLRFESLEERQMFAASSPGDAALAYVLMNCPNDFMARPEEVIPPEAVDSLAAGSGSGGPNAPVDLNLADDVIDAELAIHSDGARKTVGDVSGERLDAFFAYGSTYAFILPYLEQGNIFKAQAADRPQESCAVASAAPANSDSLNDFASSMSLASLASTADGTSNTIFLRKASGDDAAESRLGVDVWEHAFSTRTGPHHDGIIAVLIGLAVDPSEPSGNAADRVHFVFCDGSVHFIDRETIAPLLDFGADESDAITHDAAFEDWARVSQFDRGYLPPA